MTTRSGMSNLISRWRRMVDDAGTAVWSEDIAQELLDQHAVRVHYHALTPETWYGANNTAVYQYYPIGLGDLEEAASGTARWRIYDGDGDTVSTANYTPNYVKGELLFSADQAGTTYYYDGYSYDLNAAAAQAWEERMAGQVDGYDFSADGASYTRSQWFDHCERMANYYRSRSKTAGRVIPVDRSDTVMGA